MKKHLGIRGAFCVLFEVGGACVLLAFCLIFLEVGEVLSTVADEECIVFGVTVVFEGDLRLCLGADDGIHRRTVGGIAEGVVGDENIAALRRAVDTPEENMMSHGLRPNL